jgi:hypothetical protein
MALENFIKTVWSANIMSALQKAHIFASVANREYEGDLKNLGDRVRMITIGDVTAKSYTKNADLASPDDLADAAEDLVADQAYYFNFKVNDVEAVQSKPKVLAESTAKAAYAFRDAVDQHFAGLYAQAGLKCYATGTTNWDVTSLNVEDVLLAAGELMSENNVPKEGRFLIVPEWFQTKLVLAGLATKTSNDQLYTNGFIKNVLNFDIFNSNNVSVGTPSTGADTRIIGGIKGESLTFASVISKIEAYRPEKRFEDAVKGLYVFGGKVARPDKTICIYTDKTAEA